MTHEAVSDVEEASSRLLEQITRPGVSDSDNSHAFVVRFTALVALFTRRALKYAVCMAIREFVTATSLAGNLYSVPRRLYCTRMLSMSCGTVFTPDEYLFWPFDNDRGQIV